MTNKNENDLWDRLLSQALSPKGLRSISGENVRTLIEYCSGKPFMLGRLEAKLIEPVYDRDMPEYSIYGSLPSTGDFNLDKQNMNELFYKLDIEAQKEPKYAIRYDVWFAKQEME